MEWDDYFLNIAENVKLKSKDKRTQIGAVIVGKGNEIVSTGYNSFPRNINDSIEERQVRPEKYYWFEHAERNAIYNAARIGVSLPQSLHGSPHDKYIVVLSRLTPIRAAL